MYDCIDKYMEKVVCGVRNKWDRTGSRVISLSEVEGFTPSRAALPGGHFVLGQHSLVLLLIF